MVTKGEGWGRETVKKFGISMYTLLYLKWTTNKDLWYSTWALLNSMWQPAYEGSLGEMDTCMCMAESVCHAPETITILLISYAC